jgi:hypothetical protein
MDERHRQHLPEPPKAQGPDPIGGTPPTSQLDWVIWPDTRAAIRLTRRRDVAPGDAVALGKIFGALIEETGSHETRRWRKQDSNPRSPVYGNLGAMQVCKKEPRLPRG